MKNGQFKESEIKKYINNMSGKKKFFWIFFTISGPFMIFFMIIYAFSFHGMKALYDWVDIVQMIVISLGIFAALIPIIGYLDYFIAKTPKRMKFIKDRTKKFRFPSRAYWAIILIATFVPIGLISWVQISSIQRGDKPPQLLISDQIGINGIPNIGVVFWTEEAVQTQISWGFDTYDFTIEETKAKKIHVFLLEDLPANNNIWYSLEYEPYRDINYNFKTGRNKTETIKFVVSSDPHISAPRSHHDSTLNILESFVESENNIEYFFLLGDIVEYGFDDKNWREAAEFFSPYTSKIPTRTLIGNHDAMIKGVNFYKDYYYPEEMPLNSESGSTQLYQRIDINNIHFLLLDLEWGTSETYFGDQEEWLKAQLEEINENNWIIVMSHAFYYASGVYSEGTAWIDNPETIKELVPLFEEYGVNMVFGGHIHSGEHLIMNNVSYSNVGSMGGHLEPDPEIDSVAETLFYTNQNFGYFEVEIDGNTANMTFYDEFRNSIYTTLIYK